jgi:hypothetical protein
METTPYTYREGLWNCHQGGLHHLVQITAERSSSGSRLRWMVLARGFLSAVGVWTFHDPSH